MKKSLIVVVALGLLVISLLTGSIFWITKLVGSSSTTSSEVGLNVVFAVLVPLSFITFGFFFEPLKAEIKASVKDLIEQLNSKAVRLFIFGESRTGKTTFIGNMVALDTPPTQDSTPDRRVYSVRVLVDMPTQRYADLLVQDYRGQRPEDAIYMDDPFAGPPSSPRVNIIYFIVDLVPERLPNNEVVLDWTPANIKKYGPTASELIKDRVLTNERYVSKVAMRIILSRLRNPKKLRRVVLIINKIDALTSFIEGGFIDGTLSAEETALKLYENTIRDLQEICLLNGLERNYEVCVASAKFDLRTTRSKLSELLKY